MDDRKTFPLSHPQQRIWLTEKTYVGTPYFNLAYLVRLAAPADPDALAAAALGLLRRHDGLRLRIVEDEATGETVQYVADVEARPVEHHAFEDPEALRRWAGARTKVLFELVDSPLYAFALLTCGSEHYVYLLMHHIVTDGWTASLCIRELKVLLDARAAGREPDLPEAPSYREFIQAEEAYLATPKAAEDRDHWLKLFEIPPDPVNLSFKKNKAEGIASVKRTFVVPDAVRARMHAFARETKASLFKQTLAAFAIYMARHAQNPDVVIQSVNHNRVDERARAMAGMFVSIFNLRFDVDGAVPFGTFVQRVGETVNDVLKHRQRYPFDLLAADVRRRTGLNAGAFSQISIVGHAHTFDELQPEYQDTGCEMMPLNVHLNINGKDSVGVLEMEIDANPEMFDPFDVDCLFRGVVAILADGLEHPDRLLRELEFVLPGDRDTLLRVFNDTAMPFPDGKTLHGLFEEQAARTPDNMALVFKDQRFTYAELNARANQLAHRLLARGAKPDTIAAIVSERRAEIIIAMIGIMKAGMAYLPIDPKYPVDRIAFMIEDTASPVLFVTRGIVEGLEMFRDPAMYAKLLFLDDPDLATGPAHDPRPACTDRNLAYIIYTSGSTGKPKGVMIEHRAVVNLVHWHRTRYGFTPGDVCAEFASFSFDASISQTYSPLVSGASLHILPEEIRQSPLDVNDYFMAHGVTYVDLPTQFFEAFMEETRNTSLKRITTGGDKLRRFVPQAYAIYDEYGPTEFTVITTSFLLDRVYERSPIGRPVANARLYVLDANNRLAPVGFPGELCCAGVNLARGYLNREDMTALKFVPDPFVPGERMYRSGDRVRWLPDGNIDFLGRIDFQVKIRGYRIELREIEEELKKHPDLKDVIVVDRQDSGGGKFLCGYYTAAAGVEVKDLKGFLGRTLPDYMIPAVLMRLEAMPLNTSGKINRAALPEPVFTEARTTRFEEPQNDAQVKLAALFAELLGIERISIHDSFFELGGHSLKAAVLQNRILKLFGVKLSLQDIFDNPAVKALDELLASRGSAPEPVPAAALAGTAFPLSSMQQRVLVAQLLRPDSTAFNVTRALEIRGDLDVRRLQQAIDAVMAGREVLRTALARQGTGVVQVVHPAVHLKKQLLAGDSRDPGALVQDFVRPFDLFRAPLVRFRLVRYTDRPGHLFLFDAHEVLLDERSAEQVLGLILAFYGGREVPPEAHPYKDFLAWQRDYAAGPRFAADEAFWLEHLRGFTAPLGLPPDILPRPEFDFRTSRQAVAFGPEVAEALRRFSAREGLPLPSVLLSLFAAALLRHRQDEDPVLGVPFPGRPSRAFRDTLGLFENAMPVRLGDPGLPFRRFAGLSHAIVPDCEAHGNYPLAALLDRLGVPRIAGRHALFSALFQYQSVEPGPTRLAGLDLARLPAASSLSALDLGCTVRDDGSRLELVLDYKPALYHDASIQVLGTDILDAAEAFLADPDRTVSSLGSRPAALRVPRPGAEPAPPSWAAHSPAERAVVKAFARILGIPEPGLGEGFFDLGGTSLKALQLVELLSRDFDLELQDVFRFQTPGALARNLRPGTGNVRRFLLRIQDFLETYDPPAPDAACRRALRAYRQVVQGLRGVDLSGRLERRTALLTGATGYLGVHLLRELLAEGLKVIALVRGKDDVDAADRLARKVAYSFGDGLVADRLEVLAGSLEAPRLGLDEAMYARLCAEVDTIFNAAANVRHYGPYEAFYATNVQSVVHLVELARTGKPKELNHVSTVSVGMGEIPGRPVVLFTEEDADLGQRSDNVYLQTKLESEKVCLRAREEGIRANVFRVANLAFHSRTGHFQENLEENAFFSQLRAFVTLGAVPVGEENDFTYIDQAARAIVTLAGRSALPAGTYHIENPFHADLADILADPALGLGLTKMDPAAFVERLFRDYERPRFARHIQDLLLHKGWMELEWLTRCTRFIVRQDKTRAFLDALGFRWSRPRPAAFRGLATSAVAERRKDLDRMPLFRDLEPPQLERLAFAVRDVYADSRDDILWENEASEHFYVVAEGFVELTKHALQGWLGTLFVAQPGDCLNLGALFGQPSDVIATPVFDGVRLLQLPSALVRRLAAENPAFGLRLLRESEGVAARLRRWVVDLQ